LLLFFFFEDEESSAREWEFYEFMNVPHLRRGLIRGREMC
jgi:hypothetical protein